MKIKTDEEGFIIGSLLVLMLIIGVLLTTITSAGISNFQIATKENSRVNAQFASDSGLDQGIYEININETWPGTGYTWDGTSWIGISGEKELFNDGNIRTTFQVTVTDTSSDQKTIRSIGRTYKPSSSTTAEATRIFELEAKAVTSGYGPGSVVSGVGGLILNNNAKITGGDVIVNGAVQVNNNAQIGLSTNPINLRVAYQSCPLPANSTYPQVCTTGQPITNNGQIYGDVQAQNQTTATGMSLPGLTGSSFAPIAVPGYGRAAHKAALQLPPAVVGNPTASGYLPNNAAVSCGNNQSKTWSANIKITGNVSFGNNCTVTITGNVWITGNITFGNNAKIIVANSLNSTRPVIMIDGSAGMNTGNNTNIIPNSSGTGAEVVTMWWNTNTATNGGFTCGGIADPYECSTVTGLALSTSQSVTTINLSNNTNASNTVFRTLWSRAVVSNNGSLGAVAGQTIQLSNNAVINFTASISGSDNIVKTWVKRGYLRVFQ